LLFACTRSIPKQLRKAALHKHTPVSIANDRIAAIYQRQIPKNNLDMSLHRRLGDIKKSRNVFVGIPSDNPFKNCDLPQP
jgi:hypothetical protein